jgi:uncharacterized protein DUF5317
MGGVVLVILAVLAGVIAGGVRGGRLDGLTQAEVKMFPALLIGLALQGAAALASALDWVSGAVPTVMLLALAALGVFTIANRPLPGMLLIGLGVLLNLTVIGLNGGMPVTDGARERAGQTVASPPSARPDARHVRVDEQTHLRLLADVLAVRPFRTVVSVGDITQYAGVFLLVQGLIVHGEQAKRPRYETYKYR